MPLDILNIGIYENRILIKVMLLCLVFCILLFFLFWCYFSLYLVRTSSLCTRVQAPFPPHLPPNGALHTEELQDTSSKSLFHRHFCIQHLEISPLYEEGTAINSAARKDMKMDRNAMKNSFWTTGELNFKVIQIKNWLQEPAFDLPNTMTCCTASN